MKMRYWMFVASTLFVSACFDVGIADDATDTNDSDTNADTDSNTLGDSDADADIDTSQPTDCTGLDDFSLCSVVTFPDRSYDICINGICQSPGCGTPECNAPGPHFQLPDGNQRICYDGINAMTCAEEGQALYGQDAQYGWDVTNPAAERFTRDTSVVDNPVVTDNITGLSWQGCTDGLSGDACNQGAALSYTWEDALAQCDSLSWGGYDDWRLPDPYEMDSIVDSGRYSPAIDVSAFPGTPLFYFWTSASFARYSGRYSGIAWFEDFNFATMYANVSTKLLHVRCVRGGPMHTRRLDVSTAAGARLVTDSATGLQWQGCPAGLSGNDCATGTVRDFSWTGALFYCESLDWGGFSDWRLPNQKELSSNVDMSQIGPPIDSSAFPATPETQFWTSTFYPADEGRAYGITFDSSPWKDLPLDSQETEPLEYVYVRCVRGGE